MTKEASIASNVARLRLDRQMTQEELAAKAGFSRGGAREDRARCGHPACTNPRSPGRGARGLGRGARNTSPSPRERPIPGTSAGTRTRTDSGGSLEMVGRLRRA